VGKLILCFLSLTVGGCGAYDQKDCYVYGECRHPTRPIPGPSGQPGSVGATGSEGKTGQRGAAGMEGKSCTVTEEPDGALISCEDGTSTFIANGPQGAPGTNAIIEVIDPCGPNPDGPDEILLVLSTGQIVAWYWKVGLVALSDGDWATTDGQHCQFTVTDGQFVP
jgi:hypothetical protein